MTLPASHRKPRNGAIHDADDADAPAHSEPTETDAPLATVVAQVEDDGEDEYDEYQEYDE